MYERLHAIMTTDVVTVSPSDSVLRVHEIIQTQRLHHLPVTDDDGRLVGIITSYDLMQMGVCPEDYVQYQVENVMTTSVAFLNPYDQIGAAAEVFMLHLFHGLPIVDDDHRLVGIVTTHDVLKYCYYRDYPAEKPAKLRAEPVLA